MGIHFKISLVTMLQLLFNQLSDHVAQYLRCVVVNTSVSIKNVI